MQKRCFRVVFSDLFFMQSTLDWFLHHYVFSSWFSCKIAFNLYTDELILVALVGLRDVCKK